MIPFGKPYICGTEEKYISQVISEADLGVQNSFGQKCQAFFKEQYGFSHCLFTSSCSSALDIVAKVCDLTEADEVIVPSFGYVTTASAFDATKAKVIFADSEEGRPHISVASIVEKITPQTKALVVVHYAGQGCDMEAIMQIVNEHQLILIEDCAHAINAQWKGRFLGTFGHFSTFSFHRTKNIHCDEGGMLVINDEHFLESSQNIWNEGTNKLEFQNGETSYYEWVAQGSSYQPPGISLAFLYAQLEALDRINETRVRQWNYYRNTLDGIRQKVLLTECSKGQNGHIFHLKCTGLEERDALISHLNSANCQAYYHYQPLHLSQYWLKTHPIESLPNAEDWANSIVRLPLFHELETPSQAQLCKVITDFFS